MGRVVWGSLGQFGVVCIEEEYMYIFQIYIYTVADSGWVYGVYRPPL